MNKKQILEEELNKRAEILVDHEKTLLNQIEKDKRVSLRDRNSDEYK